MATADLWVYNAENLCVSFFYQVASLFTYEGGGEIKKVVLGLPNEEGPPDFAKCWPVSNWFQKTLESQTAPPPQPPKIENV